MKCKELFDVIDSMEKEYINIWEDVCNIESPTSYKKGVDEVGKYFIKFAHKRGWKVEVLQLENAGNAVCIILNPDINEESVTFSGHIDTVHPLGFFGNPAVRRDDINIYGPGVMDCKGGVVASLMAIDALEKCGFNARPVQLIIQTDEETSSKNSNKKTVEFMCEKARNSIAFLNTEGIQGDTAVLARKGIIRFKFTVLGVAVHSAKCTKGANAITEAAHKILKLEELKNSDGITCNCGVINGGTAPNSVAAECVFYADIRFNNKAECDEAIKIVTNIAKESFVDGCTCKLEQISYRPAMSLTNINSKLLYKMNEIYAKNNLPVLEQRYCLGGSDAAYITEFGIPCIDSIGVDGGNIHSVNEFARLDSLKEAAKRLASVAYCI